MFITGAIIAGFEIKMITQILHEKDGNLEFYFKPKYIGLILLGKCATRILQFISLVVLFLGNFCVKYFEEAYDTVTVVPETAVAGIELGNLGNTAWLNIL